jgi:hypothetical protein
MASSFMASSYKRRFRDPQRLERSNYNVRNAIPQTTRCKNRWGVRIFEDWQSWRENKARRTRAHLSRVLVIRDKLDRQHFLVCGQHLRHFRHS